MSINFSKLKTGDTFFVRSYTPFGLAIQCKTGWGKPTHCGKIIMVNYTPYVVEMIGDLIPFDNDMLVRPLSYYTKRWRFWTSIISIKRNDVYIDAHVQAALVRWVNEQRPKTHYYDYDEALSHVFKWKKDKSPKLICSRLVYDVDVMCGVNFGDDTERFLKKVSPVDLWLSPAYYEVANWKREKDEKNRFRNSVY